MDEKVPGLLQEKSLSDRAEAQDQLDELFDGLHGATEEVKHLLYDLGHVLDRVLYGE